MQCLCTELKKDGVMNAGETSSRCASTDDLYESLLPSTQFYTRTSHWLQVKDKTDGISRLCHNRLKSTRSKGGSRPEHNEQGLMRCYQHDEID
jgi:uncharacterized protein YifN (PemK superfamily)